MLDTGESPQAISLKFNKSFRAFSRNMDLHMDLRAGLGWRKAMYTAVVVSAFLAMILPRAYGGRNNSVTIGQNATKPQTPIKIAILLPNRDRRLFSIHRVSPAISYAIETVEKRQLIPSVKLSVKYADSWCDIALSMNEAINFYMQREVNLFLGPTCDYAAAPVARQSKFWQVPMVTAGAMHRDFGINKVFRYTYLTRIGHNIGSLGSFLVSVLTKFDWKKILLAYDPKGHQDIMHQYCHITMDGLHYALKEGYSELNIIPDYSKFDKLSDITEQMPKVIGNEYGGKSIYFSPPPPSTPLCITHTPKPVLNNLIGIDITE